MYQLSIALNMIACNDPFNVNLPYVLPNFFLKHVANHERMVRVSLGLDGLENAVISLSTYNTMWPCCPAG